MLRRGVWTQRLPKLPPTLTRWRRDDKPMRYTALWKQRKRSRTRANERFVNMPRLRTTHMTAVVLTLSSNRTCLIIAERIARAQVQMPPAQMWLISIATTTAQCHFTSHARAATATPSHRNKCDHTKQASPGNHANCAMDGNMLTPPRAVDQCLRVSNKRAHMRQG